MAQPDLRRKENVDGDVYVDSSCIDCATCRHLAPGVFTRESGASAVTRQPARADELAATMRAVVSCPTASIGVQPARPRDLGLAARAFPQPLVELMPEAAVPDDQVYYCGYHSEKSYGAASYFIRHPAGNVLVDSPRFAGPLVRRLEELGGIRYLYLTHRDDVADHEKFQKHFGCQRILHADDVGPDTGSVEIQPTGQHEHRLSAELNVIPVPGHTRGHTVLRFGDYLFTGDHLAYSHSLGHLYAFRNACWFSWPTQIESMERLRSADFRIVLPGHGARYHTATVQAMRAELDECIAWMKTK